MHHRPSSVVTGGFLGKLFCFCFCLNRSVPCSFCSPSLSLSLWGRGGGGGLYRLGTFGQAGRQARRSARRVGPVGRQQSLTVGSSDGLGPKVRPRPLPRPLASSLCPRPLASSLCPRPLASSLCPRPLVSSLCPPALTALPPCVLLPTRPPTGFKKLLSHESSVGPCGATSPFSKSVSFRAPQLIAAYAGGFEPSKGSYEVTPA
jgi:hypothetical protein